MNNAITHDPIYRRTFLKLAAGTAAGAMLFKFPFTASAKEAAAAMEIDRSRCSAKDRRSCR